MLKYRYGISAIDYDNDGYVEIVDAGLTDGFFRIYESNHEKNNSVKMYSKEQSLGSGVTITYDNQSETRFKNSGTDYVSQSSPTLHFGTSDTEMVDEVSINWSDGSSDVYRNMKETRQSWFQRADIKIN